jgi:hypothetical protein
VLKFSWIFSRRKLLYVCDNFVIGFFSMSSTMLRVAEDAAQAEEAEDIV